MSVLGGNPLLIAGDDAYTISRSVRLRSSASAYFNRTPASAGNRKTWTWSGWVKRGALVNGATYNNSTLFSAGVSNPGAKISFDKDTNNDAIQVNFTAGTNAGAVTTSVYRDVSAWYHIVVAIDTTQATSANRVKIYVNNVQVTAFNTANYPSQNTDYDVNNTVVHNIGRASQGSNEYFDGYLTEINFIDGQALTPSSFGETDAITGVWKPKKYAGTYGTNGFYLNFSDNSNNTAATIGKDYSGNGNNWTPNNISVTAGVTYDSMLDVPTPYADGGNGRGNYAVLNPLTSTYSATFSEANLKVTLNGANSSTAGSTIAVSRGKWYAEMTVGSTNAGARTYPLFGICNPKTFGNPDYLGDGSDEYSYSCDGYKTNNNSATSVGTTLTTNNVMQIAFDADNGKLWWGKDGTWIASGDPAAGTNAMYSGIPSAEYIFAICGYTSTNAYINFGQRPFAYTPPTGFKALNTQNLPDPTIKKGNAYFDAIPFVAANGAGSVTSAAFQPDFVWIKDRQNAIDHYLHDSVRTAGKYLSSNTTGAEGTGGGVTGFLSNGFSHSIGNTANWVSWLWKKGATPGFDIVTFTGTGSARTVNHSLGVTPAWIIVRNRSGGGSWWNYHQSLGATKACRWEDTIAAGSYSTIWNNTAPTSSVFTVGTSADVNGSSASLVAYLFAEVAGFSKFGSYTGNGSADGPFVFCGFRPRFLLVKRTDAGSAENWRIIDTARRTYNVQGGEELYPNSSAAEGSGSDFADITSNGFKIRAALSGTNASGGTYIFAAFAENPFKYSLAR